MLIYYHRKKIDKHVSIYDIAGGGGFDGGGVGGTRIGILNFLYTIHINQESTTQRLFASYLHL